MTELELLFISPEGQILDTLHRGWVASPQAISLDNGRLFVTYFNYDTLVSQQILVWADANGIILREDTLALSNIRFAYPQGSEVVLVEYNPHQANQRTVIEANLHPFATDGTPQPIEPLYVDTLAQGWSSAFPGYEYLHGELKVLIAAVQPGQSPQYRLRLIRHTPGSTIVHNSFDPGPLPNGYSATYWTVATAPWNMAVIGFAVQQNSPGTDRQLWVEGLDQNGDWSGMVHTIQIAGGWQANGISLAASGTTAYGCFTTVSLTGETAGGAYLTGFPLDEIVAVDEEFTPQPESFHLSAYPNPFNAVVRLDYELSSAGPVTLTVFDLTGREVTTLTSGMRTAGRHSVLWNAADLPSGIYLARLNAGDVSRSQKLVLLK